jgi:hypothetical protein
MPVFSEDTLVRILFVLIVGIAGTIVAGFRVAAAWRGHPESLSTVLFGRPRDPELRRRADLFRWLVVITLVWFFVTAFAMTRPA